MYLTLIYYVTSLTFQVQCRATSRYLFCFGKPFQLHELADLNPLQADMCIKYSIMRLVIIH